MSEKALPTYSIDDLPKELRQVHKKLIAMEEEEEELKEQHRKLAVRLEAMVVGRKMISASFEQSVKEYFAESEKEENNTE